LPESRSTDTNYLTRQYVTRHEEKAQIDVFNDTTLGEEMIEILKEYSERKTIESQIVKDADMLDQDIEMQELAHEGNKTVLPWKKNRATGRYPHWYTKAGKDLQRLISTSDPSLWHSDSPANRYNGGDWSNLKSQKSKRSKKSALSKKMGKKK
jgi:hypothetical protein